MSLSLPQSLPGSGSKGRFKFNPKFTGGEAVLLVVTVVAIAWLRWEIAGTGSRLDSLRTAIAQNTTNIRAALSRLNPVQDASESVTEEQRLQRGKAMNFEVRLLYAPQPGSPKVSVVGLPTRVGAPARPHANIFEMPDAGGAIVQFNVEFPAARQTLEVLANVAGASGADVSLLTSQHVVIQLLHAGAMESQPQCTVSCPQSGKNASGPGACIECTDGTHIVRICC